jgi:hypothetical protein
MPSSGCTQQNNFVQISSEMRHQVRDRMQMILSSMELDRPREMIAHITELVNIANRYLDETEKPRPERNSAK